MNPIVESSVVVRWGRRLVAGSRVAHGIASLRRLVRRFDETVSLAAAEKAARLNVDQLDGVVAVSRVLRAADVVLSAPFVAWQHSRTRGWAEAVAAAIARMPLSDRIRLAGWMVAVAVVTRGALYVLSGAELTVTTLAVWATVLGAAIVAMRAHRSVALAWTEWQQRKV